MYACYAAQFGRADDDVEDLDVGGGDGSLRLVVDSRGAWALTLASFRISGTLGGRVMETTMQGRVLLDSSHKARQQPRFACSHRKLPNIQCLGR